MMRLNGPTRTGFSLDANPTNVIPAFLASASAAELMHQLQELSQCLSVPLLQLVPIQLSG